MKNYLQSLWPQINNSKCRQHSDFLVCTSSENLSTTKPIGLLDRFGILNKLRRLPGRLNDKFHPNSVRFDWWV